MSTSTSRKDHPVDIPKVSISIICYNQEDYIEEAVVSAVQQNYDNLQVVVSDDCSTDGTMKVLENLERQYGEHRLKIVKNKMNGGITRNSNIALEHCDGDFVAFQGGDDVLYQNKIRLQVKWFERNPSAVLCGHQLNVVEENSLTSFPHKRSLNSGTGPRYIIEHGHPYGATSIMVKASAIPEKGFDEKIPNISDGLFWVETLVKGGDFGYINGTFGMYRKHANNFTNKKIEAIWQLEQYYNHISNKYPEFRRSCRRGKGNVLYYGLGLVYSDSGEFKKSWKFFARSFLNNPFNLKLFYKMLVNLTRQVKRV